MKKSYLIILSVLLFGNQLLFAQTDIADARTYAVGATVTVTGIVTNGSELGVIRYLQDVSAGIAAYPGTGSVSFNPTRGSSVTITGVIKDYNGLLEIDPVTSYTLNSTGNPLPAPALVIPSQMVEPLEAQLITVENCLFSTGGNFANNTNYTFTSSTQSGVIRITGNSNSLIGQAIPTGAVDITGPLSEYNTLYQLLPRDQNDIVPYVAPTLEINITQGTTTVLTGSTFVVGNSPFTIFAIENQGATQNLDITSFTIGGVDAGDFNIASMPTSVTPGSSQNFTLDFTPSGPAGSKYATITINNNDVDENPYIINISAISGSLGTEPTAQATALTFSNLKSYTLNVSYTAASPAVENYLVLRRKGSAVTGAPVDGTTYERGDYIGSDQVAYIGNGTAFTPLFIVANSDYYFQVFAFNGPAGYENYLTSAPLSGNALTPDGMINNYYTGIDALAPGFVSNLSALINPHATTPYVNYLSTMINNFESRDTTLGRKVVTCVYSGENRIYSGAFNWTALGYSREHTYPHSWMPTFPADDPEKPEYNDQHHLFPTNLDFANVPRLNHPLGNVVTVTSSYMGGTLGKDANGKTVYEPRDAHKGDAARALMYMAVCYNGISSNNWALPSVPNRFQDQNTLKSWHFQDLPDDWEIARNDFIAANQNNRNPFIDSVNFACYIDFHTMTYISNPSTPCTGVGINEKVLADIEFFIYPNPGTDRFNVNYTLTLDETVMVTITDIYGKVVLAETYNGEKGLNQTVVNTAGLAAGIYMMNFKGADYTKNSKIIVQ